jgi:hypothetical protein
MCQRSRVGYLFEVREGRVGQFDGRQIAAEYEYYDPNDGVKQVPKLGETITVLYRRWTVIDCVLSPAGLHGQDRGTLVVAPR